MKRQIYHHCRPSAVHGLCASKKSLLCKHYIELLQPAAGFRHWLNEICIWTGMYMKVKAKPKPNRESRTLFDLPKQNVRCHQS